MEPHIRLALAAGRLLPAGGYILDLGSGGGLPGLPLIAGGVGAKWVLLDGSVTRCEFLRQAVTELGIDDRVEVLALRAEVAGRESQLRGAFDAVISRSFGPPSVTAECGAPFLKPGGILVVAEPPAGSEIRWPAEGLEMLGLVADALHEEDARYQVLRAVSPTPDRFPRRVGIPAKRPLF